MQIRNKDIALKKDKKYLEPIFILSAAICFMFFLYAPIELYFTNKSEFWYDIWVLLPIMLCVWFIFTLICIVGFIILYKCGIKLYNTAVIAMFVTFLCSYIQGNYLIEYLPAMDGRSIDWNLYAGGRTQTIILWIIVSAAMVLLVKKFYIERLFTLIQIVCICMILMFIFTLSILCFSNNGLESKTNICVTTNYELTMSDDQNFIILLLDTLDGGAFSDIISGNDEQENIFEDFTYYDNTLSAYPHTGYNVPFILSGEWFENQITSDEYFYTILTGSKLFDELENRKYSINLYEQDINIDARTKERFENVGMYTKKVSSYFDFARWQIMLVGMKYAPFDLKRFCFVNPAAFEWLRVADGDSQVFHDDNMQFYHLIREQEIQYCSNNNFKFIHLWGAHPPYEYDKDLNYLPNGGTFIQSVEACITLTDMYLKKLKESDVYDNSVIIIMADHGNGEYYEEDNLNQHPVLMIKGIHEKHKFEIDHRPISFTDLQEAYIKLLDGESGKNVFDHLPQERRRRFLWYDIKDDEYIVEYEQTGQAGDMETMLPTGQEFNMQE